MKLFIANLTALALAIFLCAASFPRIEGYSKIETHDIGQDRESLYLPNGRALEFLTFGSSKVLGHILWFKTISYFAKHWKEDKNYTWLEHMCSLVIRLNPDAAHVYQFCGVMLSWEGNKPHEAVDIFSKAVTRFPDNWLFYYLRGFNLAFFLNEDQKAREDFVKAASLPGAHPIVIRLASREIANMDSPENAIEFLNEALMAAPDKQTREVLTDRLKEIFLEIGRDNLKKAAQKFNTEKGRLPSSLDELADTGYVSKELQNNKFSDPFGGHYYLDTKTQEVLSTSRKRKTTPSWKRSR